MQTQNLQNYATTAATALDLVRDDLEQGELNEAYLDQAIRSLMAIKEAIRTEPRCCTDSCGNAVEEPGDLCHGCEADQSHRNQWGSSVPMDHHQPS